jgi:hypothetical protein
MHPRPTPRRPNILPFCADLGPTLLPPHLPQPNLHRK